MANDDRPKRPLWLPEVDLRAVTRNSDRAFTNIGVVHHGEKFPWIRAGLLSRVDLDRKTSQWVGAYFDHGITDMSEDSAYAFHFDVVGAHVSMIHYGVTVLRAWLASGPFDHESFHVPSTAPDLETFEWCTQCKGKERHRMTDYTPRADVELWKKMRGVELTIEFGPVIPEAER